MSASLAGIKLKQGELYVLSLDGTLVYVEEVTSLYVLVIALPEQDAARADERILVPGRVGGKKISPYAGFDHHVEHKQLSERNQRFLQFYVSWRDEHGPGYVDLTDEEKAKMTVIKAGPKPVIKGPTKKELRAQARAERSEQRAEKRAAKKAAAPSSFTLVGEDLTMARATERGDRYNDGNRSFRVFAALQSLPEKTGTVEEITAALAQDGGKVLGDYEKIVRRTLAQLQQDDHGALVRANS